MPARGMETESPARQLDRLKQEYEMILQSAGVGICKFDEAGRVTFVNRGAAFLLGHEPGEILGRLHEEVFRGPGEGKPAASPGEGASSYAFRGSDELRPRTGEDVYVRKDGTPLPVEYTCTPVLKDGRVKGAVLVFQDVSRRKEAERERDRLLTLVEETPHFVSTCDVNGKLLYVNKAGRRLLGIPEEGELPGWRVSRETLALIAKATEQGMWHGRRTDFLQDFLGEGKGIAVLQTVVAHKGSNGSVEFYSTIAMDITEQQRLEEERARLAAIIEDTPDFVATADADGRVLYYNRAARRMLGFGDDEDIRGVHIPETHPEWARDLVLNEGLPTAARCGVWRGETALLTRDGRTIPVSQVIVAHKNKDGVVEYFSTIARDVSDRKRAEQQLDYLASHDFLTGLVNRGRFQEHLAQAVSCSKSPPPTGALLFLDLDNFKDINDSLGHHAGDRVLQRVAEALRSIVGDDGIVGRLGGDEFAILLPGATPEQAQAAGERLLCRLRREMMPLEGQSVAVRASLGIALYPGHGQCVDDLLIAADVAMYRAKRAGGNRMAVYSPGAKARKAAASRLNWERRIRESLRSGGFTLYWQPLVDVRLRRVEAFELLLRMKDGEELISPQQFLPVAERSDLIHDIDRWVVSRALELLHRGQTEGVSLHVNLSGRSLSDPGFLAFLQDAFRRSVATKPRVELSRLVLEVTETVAIQDATRARLAMDILRQAGCRFALDDFGVGFSSFGVLRTLPVDVLKIDGSFIRNLVGDPVNQHLVRAMIEVARGLGKRTVAEFVPDETALKMLADYGIDLVQGFHVGRPEPVPLFH